MLSFTPPPPPGSKREVYVWFSTGLFLNNFPNPLQVSAVRYISVSKLLDRYGLEDPEFVPMDKDTGVRDILLS